jgi:hypothetical protein
LFSILVFGDEIQNCRTAIFGLRILVGAPGAEIGPLVAKTIPLNN